MRCIAVLAVTLLTFLSPVLADWNPGDPHKMHAPQLPDPTGWDIEIASIDRQHEIADDWQCSQTGPVEDVHFWTSWALGQVGVIEFIEVSIYANVPDPNPGDPLTFSQPGVELWNRVFDATEFTIVDPYGSGLQGFADPQQPIWTPDDHNEYQQINIVNITNPFTQTEGEIYWLGIHAWWTGGAQQPVGWKTTDTVFEDTAVYRPLAGPEWLPLVTPVALGEVPLDLAFVITGEPPMVPFVSTVGLIGIGLLLLAGVAFMILRSRSARTT